MFSGGIMERDLEKVVWNRLATFPFLMACELKENIKVRFSPSKKVGFICFNGRHFKMMKNAFYFISEYNFILKIFKFLSNLFW